MSGAETQMAWQENDGKLGAGPLDDCAGTQGRGASKVGFVSWSRGSHITYRKIFPKMAVSKRSSKYQEWKGHVLPRVLSASMVSRL